MIGAGTWSGLTFALVGAAAIAIAAVVLVAAPPRRANRLLAATLLAQGVYQMLFGSWSTQHWGLSFLPAAGQHWFYALSVEAATLSAAAYLLFVGVALESRWTRWLRTAAVRTSLVVLLLAHAAVWFLAPGLFVAGREWALGYYLGGVAGVVAFVASGRMLAKTRPGTAERRRALAFLVAFGVRNVLLLRILMQAVAEDVFGVALLFGPISWYTDWNYDLWQDVVLDGVFLVVLSYGVLTGQLVTLDERIQATIQKAGVVAAVSVLFIALTEGVETLLGVESVALGILAAVLISLLFQPIQSLAARAAGRLVPGPDRAQAMSLHDREGAYREQAAIAWSDGVLTDKERRMLERLGELLGLDPAACRRLEPGADPGPGAGPDDPGHKP